MKRSKSQFDTGRWSETTGLPHEADMTALIEHLVSEDPKSEITRKEIEEWIASEFEIPSSVLTAPGPESNTPQFRTSVSHVISNSLVGERNSEGNAFLKRVDYATYQHITGPSPAYTTPENRNLFNEACAFMRHARKLNFSLGEAKDMWKDRFPSKALEQAATIVFA